VLSNKERLDLLIKENIWQSEKDKEIEELHFQLINLKQTKSKLFVSKQIQEINDRIKETEKQYINLKLELKNLNIL